MEMNAVTKEVQEELRKVVVWFLRDWKLKKLNDEEWTAILHIYPERYWGFVREVVSVAHEECHTNDVRPQGMLLGQVRADIDWLLKELRPSSLTDEEWGVAKSEYYRRHKTFISKLIGEVRGEQHFRDVEAAYERERKRTFSDLRWLIDWRDVEEYCYENDEAPLSDDEMEKLFDIWEDQFDRDQIVSEALHCLRSGTPRCVGTEPSSTMVQCV
jgi:hypothetical protein